MELELQEIENTLKGLRPGVPDEACMVRLLAALEGRLQQKDPAMSGVETELVGMSPSALPAGFEAASLAKLSRVTFPSERKVLAFPGGVKAERKPVSRMPWYAAAAAVAVAGAFSALMVGEGQAPIRAAQAGREKFPVAEGFVPASVGTGLDEASDEGVRWTAQGKPVRMLRVIYKDRVEYRNAEGKIIEVERPRVEYLIVPEKMD
ncbi:MAG: hypothetical protein EAZ65_01910 [Verrucomicrobia bacterium]|nr:MAG: hypothetical protein EAZ84_07955 [Verrucomicrobiota bacterium]TAE85868.1 MAG: hypothetical protein EAZ82_12570 [Verrucomicrobiota bacterium]TAF27381.1 MAG: hypothetical protein EAZ71_02780 [Verrucomicrobiota bacterium]TAF42328.1 MAG: hypothetical protein EAZ65_01910 [Verrucomicrobiota bacterium]